MEYSKPLKEIEVKTLGDSEFTASDTATQPIASDALASFKAKKTMRIKGEKTNLVPFHAVEIVEVIKNIASVVRPDPYGCEDNGSNSKLCFCKTCEAVVGC